MPKNLKALDSTEGRAPLLVPHPEQEDENFRQLARFTHELRTVHCG